MAKRMVCKGFTISERVNGSFHVKYTSKGFGKTWSADVPDFCTAGEWVWNMADNHDIGREVNHKMCEKWGRSFFEDTAPIVGEYGVLM